MTSEPPANLGVLMDSRDETLVTQATLRLIAESLVQTHSEAAVPVKTTANGSIFDRWDALAEIARRENYTQTQLCTRIADGQPQGLSFTASVRMFILTYFRTAAHGMPMPSFVGTRDQEFVGDFEAKHGTR